MRRWTLARVVTQTQPDVQKEMAGFSEVVHSDAWTNNNKEKVSMNSHTLTPHAWQALMSMHAAKCRGGHCPLIGKGIPDSHVHQAVLQQCVVANESDVVLQVEKMMRGVCQAHP